ncbi:MAG: hypothetical protein ABJA80_10225 [bacterium]
MDDGLSAHTFSPGLASDIGAALGNYLASPGPDARAEAALRSVTNRVCTEAKGLGLPPEKMLIAIKQLFDHTPLPDTVQPDRRRKAFERFITGCIDSYFSGDHTG